MTGVDFDSLPTDDEMWAQRAAQNNRKRAEQGGKVRGIIDVLQEYVKNPDKVADICSRLAEMDEQQQQQVREIATLNGFDASKCDAPGNTPGQEGGGKNKTR